MYLPRYDYHAMATTALHIKSPCTPPFPFPSVSLLPLAPSTPQNSPATTMPSVYPPADVVRRQLSESFRDDRLMNDPSPISLSKKAFKHPRLRRYSLPAKDLAWRTAESLGNGIDGWTFKMTLEDDQIVAVKLVSSCIQRLMLGYLMGKHCQMLISSLSSSMTTSRLLATTTMPPSEKVRMLPCCQ